MDVSGGLSLVQTILQVMGLPIWMNIESVLGLKSQLKKLKDTMSVIEAVLLDAEEVEQQQTHRLSHVQFNRLRRLKDALYQADDLFDEIATRKKLMPRDDKMSNDVWLFFSRFNQLFSAFTWSEELKMIRETLDDIVKDNRHDIGLRPAIGLEAKQLRINARETYSYVYEKGVFIGREEDKEKVIDMLLDTTVKTTNVSVVTIVGIGGMGKTTLAQQVYNDERIKGTFPLKMWVCVSDDFNIKVVLRNILISATNKTTEYQGENQMDKLQKDLRQELDKKKYLLVLDDVWNDNSEEWQKLKDLLDAGGRGSKILVTTRSEKVAYAVRSYEKHNLKGLSDNESWELFERMTVEPGQHLESPLEGIGKEIVGKCANVPLAIRVVGSLLRGQDESRWRYVRDIDLAKIKQDEIIVPVLKISYYYLPFHLKSCFSYCAIFPEDHRIIKEDLICLWMAQGFIMPTDGQSFEDAGEEYFNQLLLRCFFQDVERDEETDEIISCKMHDLIHDLAKEVAGTEILSSNSSTRCFNEKTRHLLIDYSSPEDIFEHFSKIKRMRSLLIEDCYYLSSFQCCPPILRLNEADLKTLHWYYSSSFRSKMVVSLSIQKYLRVLRLNEADLKTLPSAIGQLLHLRYLDLSRNSSLSMLPTSITKLHNLQTLKLRGCCNLKRLPRDLRKLVNLRHLDIHDCSSLTHMPPGMSSMTSSLYRLTGFVVSQRRKWGSAVGELKDLDNFTNHSATMDIYIKKGAKYNNGGEFLLKNEHLTQIFYYWASNVEETEGNNAKALLQGLQPHPNLRELKIERYHGTGFPSWGDSSSMNLQNCLPNLVRLRLWECKRLEQLPLMSQLRHLKVLNLGELEKVEYVESSNVSGDGDPTASGGSTQVEAEELTFFPCLKELEVVRMTKLKGWWKTSSLEPGNDDTREGGFPSNSYSFPQLSRLSIKRCPDLTIFPLCPNVEELEFFSFNGALGPIMRVDGEGQGQGRLKKVVIDNVGYLNSLPFQSFHHLSHLEINYDLKIERLGKGEVGEVFRSFRLSSLRHLGILECSILKSISGRGVWEHFTALETLRLDSLPELELEDEDEDDVNNNNSSSGCTREEGEIKYSDTPWRYLAPTLRSLELAALPKPVKLPKGIGALSSLQSLEIKHCNNLEALPPTIGGLSSLRSLEMFWCKKFKSLPEEMCYLTSLQNLYLWGSDPELEKRCKGPTGADWPKIRHVPNIRF